MSWPIYALLGILAAIALSAPLISGRIRELQLSQAGLGHLAELTDEEITRHLVRLFGALGYRVTRPEAGQSGFDLILADGLGQRRGVMVRHWRSPVDEAQVREAAAASAAVGKATPMIVTIQYYTFKARQAAEEQGVILWSLPDLTRAIGKVRRAAMAYPDLPGLPASSPPAESEQAAAPMTVLFGRANMAVPGGSTQKAVAATAESGEKPALKLLSNGHRKRGTRMRKGEAWSTDDVPFCPRCGKKMMVRRGAQGDYWGCPNFPRCLGTRVK